MELYAGSPPYVSFGGVDFLVVTQVGLRSGLKKRHLDFLRRIFAKSQKPYLALDEMQTLLELRDGGYRKPFSGSGVRKLIAELEQAGFLERSDVRVESTGRKANLYTLCLPTSTAFVDLTAPELETARTPQPVDRAPPSALELIGDSTRTARIDDLFCSVLFQALEFNRKTHQSIIQVKVDWYGERVGVTTRALAGKRIAMVTDLRYFIALISQCEEIIKTQQLLGEEVVNLFNIPISVINKSMGRDTTGGEIKSTLDALERLNSTQFEINEMPRKFLERHGLEAGDQRFNPLHDLGRWVTGDGRKTYFVTFGLNEMLFRAMVKGVKGLFRVNPQLLSENNEIGFAFHLWCRRRVRSGQSMVFTLPQLHSGVAPGMDYDNFVERLEACLLKHPRKSADSGTETTANPRMQIITEPQYSDGRGRNRRVILFDAALYGYFIKIRGGKYFVTTDPKDNYVGLFAGMLRRESEVIGESALPDLD